MTTMLETPVATLTAEIVTEFIFAPEYKTRLAGSPTKEIIAPYHSNYKATVGVKVGNIVKEISISMRTKYMSSYSDENGRWQSREDLQYVHIENKPFAELEEAGILVDLTPVLEQYQANVGVAEHHMALHNRYQKWIKIRRAKQEYMHSWMHRAEADLKADKNKKIHDALEHTTIEVKSLEKFLATSTHAINVNYKGISTNIFIRNNGFVFDGNSAYKLPKNWDGSDMYQYRFDIANGTNRKSKTLGSLFLKYVQAVDLELEKREARLNRLSREQQARKDKKERLEKLTGYPIVILVNKRYVKNNRGYNTDEAYNVYTYAVLTDQPTSKYAEPKYFSVNENTQSVKNEEETISTYSVNNINGLTVDQMKRILDILMEGKTALTKLEIPND